MCPSRNLKFEKSVHARVREKTRNYMDTRTQTCKPLQHRALLCPCVSITTRTLPGHKRNLLGHGRYRVLSGKPKRAGASGPFVVFGFHCRQDATAEAVPSPSLPSLWSILRPLSKFDPIDREDGRWEQQRTERRLGMPSCRPSRSRKGVNGKSCYALSP